MKKTLLMAMAAAFMCGCEKPILDDGGSDVAEETADDNDCKRFTFTVKGDFCSPTFTRGYLQADGQDMTDLWVFDYVGGICVQTVHQVATDESWGRPQMSLSYGTHHVYFVASRGDDPTVDGDAHTVVWGLPRDTFWKDYEVNVVSTSNGNRAVTLDRVATKLRLVANDEVPDGCASVTVMPERWYYGLDYVTGAAVSEQRLERVVNVPASYAGTTGQLAMNIFGLSGADEWTTNVTVTAKDGDGAVIGTATLTGAPFVRNRATEYSGSLFGSAGSMGVSLNDDWNDPHTGTW